jgi:hypothetical protein
MTLPTFSRTEAIFWGGLAAGSIDMVMMFVIWSTVERIAPILILQAIATSFMGNDAYAGGNAAASLGFVLHFLVSFCFAAAYVLASGRFSLLKTHPFLCGPVYGVIAYVFMTYAVVPLSLATFGRPENLPDLARSVLMHMFLFGLPIALATSRIRR